MESPELNDDELLSLYQDIIISHSRSPHNKGSVSNADCCTKGHNPLCGDRVVITASLDNNDLVSNLMFDGRGCAISIASASLMTDSLKGLERNSIYKVYDYVIKLCKGSDNINLLINKIGKQLAPKIQNLAPLTGVRNFPARARCATLPWSTLIACLEGEEISTTER